MTTAPSWAVFDGLLAATSVEVRQNAENTIGAA